MSSSRRFHTLDGMRGLAAIVVVFGHMPIEWCGGLKLPYFFLAVDLFFTLSGLVIAFAYEDGLKSRLTVWRFMVVRYIRLYPLYISGTIIGTISSGIALLGGKGELSGPDFFVSIASSVFLLPSPTSVGVLMPFNPPAWSLLYELLLNLFYATVLIRLSLGGLIVLAALLSVALTATVLHLGTLHTGMTWDTVPFGLIRALFPYTIGVIIYRTIRSAQYRSLWGYAAPLLMLPLYGGLANSAEAAILPCVLLLFPLLVVLGAKVDVPMPGLFEFLGLTSYAVYILSDPLITLTSRVLHVLHVSEAHFSSWFGLLFLVVLLAIASAADKLDGKVRARLSKIGRSSPSHVVLPTN